MCRSLSFSQRENDSSTYEPTTSRYKYKQRVPLSWIFLKVSSSNRNYSRIKSGWAITSIKHGGSVRQKETGGNRRRLKEPTVQSETFNHAASSLWTFRLCTTYTKPQPAAAGLTAGRTETHKNALSLKAALSVTHQPAECQRGSSEPPHRRWRSCTEAATTAGTTHPKKKNLLQMCQSVSTQETSCKPNDD